MTRATNTAVVTGGAGFIGAAVARELRQRGVRVIVAGTSSGADPLTRERIAGLPEVDLIVHCAGGSSVARSIDDPAGERAKTVDPLAQLLDHVRGRATRVVVLSSAAVYGLAEAPTPETAPLAPVSPYGEHKLACEHLTLEAGATGVHATLVRLFSVYGPGLRKQLLWDACRKASTGETFGGTGDEERDWLHVDDAVSLIVAAADRASPEVPIFNGGSGRGARVRTVVEQIFRELGAGAPQFSGERRAGDPVRYVADITRARELGWQPRVALEDGLSRFVAWFREQR